MGLSALLITYRVRMHETPAGLVATENLGPQQYLIWNEGVPVNEVRKGPGKSWVYGGGSAGTLKLALAAAKGQRALALDSEHWSPEARRLFTKKGLQAKKGK